jgi:hypothetical protein
MKSMLIRETLFFKGHPLGKICQNSNTGDVTFMPAKDSNSLASRKWRTVRDCRRAVIKTCQKENPPG